MFSWKPVVLATTGGSSPKVQLEGDYWRQKSRSPIVLSTTGGSSAELEGDY